MARNSRIVMAFVVAALAFSGLAMAQSSTYEVRRGEVVHVYGHNLVVKMADGVIREIDVDPSFLFDVDGKQLPVTALKAGMVLQANIRTTEVPHVVKHTEVRKGEVVKVVGNTLIIRRENGEIAKFTKVPNDMKFIVNGEEKTVWELRDGMHLTAHIVHETVETITERDVEVMASAPAPAPKPKPAPKPYTPAPAPAAALPSTGSQLPLIGLAGMVFIIIGLGIGILRRF